MTTTTTISEDKREETRVTYEHRFRRKGETHWSGYGFDCAPDGTLDREYPNYAEVAASDKYEDEGVVSWTQRTMLCSCGSGQHSWLEYDARGIPLIKVCDDCKESRLGVYRPDVLTDSNYWHDEPLYED